MSSIIVGLGLSGNAAAGDCESLNATFTSSIGSTTTCASFTGTGGAPMTGVVLGSGEITDTFIGANCAFTVTVPGGVGQSTDKSTEFSISDPGIAGKPLCQVKVSSFQGNQGANYCVGFYQAGTLGDTMFTLGNKGDPVPHKQAEFCTDSVADTVSPPVISLEKLVTTSVGGVYDCDQAVEQLEVVSPSEVAYCFTIRNDGVGTALDVTLSDPTISINEDLGSLAGHDDITFEKVVPITDASQVGEIINLASVTSTFEGSTCGTCSDEDTATVNVVVECDAVTQGQANTSGGVVETRTPEGISRCGPKNTSGGNNSVSLLCDGSCELRPECEDDPAACVQPCKASENWTYISSPAENLIKTPGYSYSSCVSDVEPSPGNLPLCQEVLANPGNANCNAIQNPTHLRSDGHSETYGRNPILYYFPPGSLGGNSVGVTYCILEPGDSPSVCPSGSYVY